MEELKEPVTQIRGMTKYEILTKYLQKDLEALADQLPDNINSTTLDYNLEYSFNFIKPVPRDTPEFYTDSDGTKCFGENPGIVSAKGLLNAKARKKLEELNTDSER